MNRIKYFFILAATLVLAGCSASDSGGDQFIGSWACMAQMGEGITLEIKKDGDHYLIGGSHPAPSWGPAYDKNGKVQRQMIIDTPTVASYKDGELSVSGTLFGTTKYYIRKDTGTLLANGIEFRRIK